MEWFRLFLVCSTLFSPILAQSDDFDYYGYRIPDYLIPSQYTLDLFLTEDVFQGTNTSYTGNVQIIFLANASTSEIKLHNLGSNLTSVAVRTNSSTVGVTSFDTYNTTTQILTIVLGQNLTAGTTYYLEINFIGTLRTDMSGFYLSSYQNTAGNTEYLVTTQFEPVYARRAFPCFDEPQFKASFLVTITYPTGYNALSNNLQSSNATVDATYEKATFLESPIMPTYLLAFIVSKFTCTAGDQIDETTPHRICSRPGTESSRALAVELGPPLMRSLQSITGIKYGTYNGKMDQVAIPDFNSGAMENWGLVTYREYYLLWDEDTDTNSYRESIALVVAHEFTHMWYGNLVTLKWWDYVFLNEGFARYYQYFAAAETDQLKSWQLDNRFIVAAVHSAMITDSSLTAASLTSKASTPAEISSKFGTIGYAKGASVIWMIENFMGSNSFKLAMNDYLTTYATKSTVADDLWNKLAIYTSSAYLPTNVTFNQVIANWADEAGYPVVTVTASGNDVILSQNRFLLSGQSSTEWYVPISYTVSSDTAKFSDTKARVWLIPGQNLTISDVLSNNDWIILNNNQAGYYRVSYDATLWPKVKEVLYNNISTVPINNRAQIVNDVLNYARSGLITYAKALDMLTFLKYETDYHPWYASNTEVNRLFSRIGYESTLGTQMSKFMASLMQSVYATVPLTTFDDDNQVYSLKQLFTVTRICKYGDSDCIAKVKDIYAQFKNGGSINKHFKSIVFCNALRNTDDVDNDFDFLWNYYLNASTAEKLLVLGGIGCVRDSTHIKWLLEQTLNTTLVSTSHYSTAWSTVYTSTTEGANAALEFILENYERINNYSSNYASSYISAIASYLFTEAELEKLETFAANSSTPDNLKTSATNALTTARSNIAYTAEVETELKAVFELELGTSAATVTIQMSFVAILATMLVHLLR